MKKRTELLLTGKKIIVIKPVIWTIIVGGAQKSTHFVLIHIDLTHIAFHLIIIYIIHTGIA